MPQGHHGDPADGDRPHHIKDHQAPLPVKGEQRERGVAAGDRSVNGIPAGGQPDASGAATSPPDQTAGWAR